MQVLAVDQQNFQRGLTSVDDLSKFFAKNLVRWVSSSNRKDIS